MGIEAFTASKRAKEEAQDRAKAHHNAAWNTASGAVSRAKAAGLGDDLPQPNERQREFQTSFVEVTPGLEMAILHEEKYLGGSTYVDAKFSLVTKVDGKDVGTYAFLTPELPGLGPVSISYPGQKVHERGYSEELDVETVGLFDKVAAGL